MAVGEEIVLAGWVPAEAEAVPVAGKSWEYQRDRVAGWSLSVIVLSMSMRLFCQKMTRGRELAFLSVRGVDMFTLSGK